MTKVSGNYDNDYLGVGTSLHPANQEQLELSELEILEENYADLKRTAKYLKEKIKRMEEIENDPKFIIISSSEDLTTEYIKIKSDLLYKVKYQL